MSNAIIEFNHVTKAYRRDFWAARVVAVNDCSFSVAKGSITGFVGPNGAGKTTSLKMLMGLLTPSKGSVLINGCPAHDPHSRLDCAFVTEQPYLYSHLTVLESMQLLQQVQYGRMTPIMRARIDAALTRVELLQAAHKKVKELSKGMQQRLSLAAALATSATLYVLDEPMSGLDPLGRQLFRTVFGELAQAGKTVFFSTHILDDIESLCQQIIVLSNGSLRYSGSVQELLQQGQRGIEVICDTLSADQQSQIKLRQWQLEALPDGRTAITITRAEDQSSLLELLFTWGIPLTSLKPRRTSLEEVLYKGDAKENR